ncbi:MAG: hypothetical protein P9M15_05875 [Candidatus Electryoneaceae bacterium]|nr:hypothetical protein [Candidatus Electryoneaceae bacterium]
MFFLRILSLIVILFILAAYGQDTPLTTTEPPNLVVINRKSSLSRQIGSDETVEHAIAVTRELAVKDVCGKLIKTRLHRNEEGLNYSAVYHLLQLWLLENVDISREESNVDHGKVTVILWASIGELELTQQIKSVRSNPRSGTDTNFGRIDLHTLINGELRLDGEFYADLDCNERLMIEQLDVGEHTLEIVPYEDEDVWLEVVTIIGGDVVEVMALFKSAVQSLDLEDAFFYLPEGSFMMGVDGGEADEGPKHRVKLSA